MAEAMSVEAIAVSSGFHIEGRPAEHGMPSNALQRNQGRELVRILWANLPNKTLEGILDYLREEGKIAP